MCRNIPRILGINSSINICRFSPELRKYFLIFDSKGSVCILLPPILLVPVTIAVLPVNEIKDIFAIRIFDNFIVLSINLGWYLLVDNRDLI